MIKDFANEFKNEFANVNKENCLSFLKNDI